MSIEKTIFRFTAILVMTSLLLPIVASNMPFLNRAWASMLIWLFVVLVSKPRLLFGKTMLWVYTSALINVFIALFFWDNLQGQESAFYIIIHYLFIGMAITMNSYFINYKDFQGYRIVVFTALVFILISSITSIIGFAEFPNASRTMATGFEAEDSQLHSFYAKIGIAGYGFYALGAFLLTALGFYTKKVNNIFIKLIINVAIVIFIYSNYLAQHTTILLFSVFGFLLSKLNLHKEIKLKLAGFLLIFILFNYTLPPLLDYIADNIPQESSVVFRLHDVANVLREGNFDTSTSDSYFVAERLGRSEESLDYFLQNIFIGSGKSAGHAYWIDTLSKFGLLGFIPYSMIFINSIRFNIRKFSSIYKPYYYVVFFLVIIFGLIKNMTSIEVWVGLFFILPGIYYLTSKETR